MLFWVLNGIGLIVLMIASGIDLKSREVPDTLSYGFLALLIAARTLYWAETGDQSVLVQGGLGLLLALCIGTGLYYAGQWGGADAKLLWGMGVLYGLSWSYTMQPFVLFLLNLLIAGALYGICWSVIMVLIHQKRCIPHIILKISQYRTMHILLFLFVGMTAVVLWNTDSFTRYLFWGVGVLCILTFYLWIVIRVLEEVVLIKRLPTHRLTEGDWVAKPVYINDKEFVGPKTLGLEKEHIVMLQKHHVSFVWIKEGIPFVPSFLIAFLLTSFGPNWFVFLNL